MSRNGSEIRKDWTIAKSAQQPSLSILVVVSCAAALVVDARLRPGSFGSVAVAAGSYFHDPGVDRRLTRQHLVPELPPIAAPAPGRPTAFPISAPAPAPPTAPIPAPFSLVVSDPPEQPFSPTNTSSPITNSDDLGPRVGLDVFILLATAPFTGSAIDEVESLI